MLRELLATFSIDTSAAVSAMKNIDGAISKTTTTLTNLANAFIGSAMVSGAKAFIQDQIDAAKELRITAARIGVSTDALQEWNFAAGAAGVSSEGMAVGMKFLNKNIGLALTGNEEAAKTFSQLHLNVKNADGSVRELGDVLPDIANAFKKMGSQQERTTYAMQLFGRQGADLLPLLQDGAEGVEALRKKFYDLGGGMSKEFIARAKDAGRAMGGTKFALNAVKRAIVFEALPAFTSFNRKTQEWAAGLLKFSKETNFAKESVALFGLASGIATAKAVAGFAKLMGVIPSGAGFWKTVLGLGEFAIIIALVAALALGLEDVYTWLKGGDSLTGDFIDGLFGIGKSAEVLEEVNKAFDEISATIEAMRPLLDLIGSLFSALWTNVIVPALGEFGKAWLENVVTQIKLTAQLVEWLAKKFGEFLGFVGNAGSAVGKLIQSDKLLNFASAASRSSAAIANAPPQPSTVPFGPPPPPGGPTRVNQQNSTTIVNNIQGTANAKETAEIATDMMSDAWQRELANAGAAVKGGG